MSKRQVTVSADQISERWNKGMKANVNRMVEGVNAVQENPMELAAQNLDKAMVNYNAAITSGKTAAQLRKVSKTDWQQKTAKKMVERVPGGVDAAMPKRKTFDQYLRGALNQVLPEIADMDSMTIDDKIARSARLQRFMHENPYKSTS